MTYTPEILDALTKALPTSSIPELSVAFNIPERSLIAKLSSMGLYKRKAYVTKQGEVPVKKEEYIDRIATILAVDTALLQSLEKVNKGVLKMLEVALTANK